MNMYMNKIIITNNILNKNNESWKIAENIKNHKVITCCLY